MPLHRGTILQPNSSQPSGFEMIPDGIVAVDERGNVVHVGPVAQIGDALRRQMISIDLQSPQQQVIMLPTVDIHEHVFQPPGIPGRLIERGHRDGHFQGWLPKTLRHGEVLAKQNFIVAQTMARAQLSELVKNGVGTVLAYATSSVRSVRDVLAIADELGVRARVGYVCMDQGLSDIAPELQTSSEEAISSTRALLDEEGPQKIVVIDRFTLAVSSQTQRALAQLAREKKAGFETHAWESTDEESLHLERYNGFSQLKTLIADGVFSKGGRVGIAHGLHITEGELQFLQEILQDMGCQVFVRACPNSNAMLASHFDDHGRYVEFPLRRWQEIGATITLGTDRGAGRNANIFGEMLDERGRHPAARQPSYAELLRFGTLNGYRSLGIDPDAMRIAADRPAEFAVVKMAGADGFYKPAAESRDIEQVAARAIEGGSKTENVLAMYVNGKKLK